MAQNENTAYTNAKKEYEAFHIDVESALKKAAEIPISIHCWQCDDVSGLENTDGALTGGIQTTGNYFGKARNGEEIRMDLQKAMDNIPGEKKINIHASYLEAGGEKVDRDAIKPEHFKPWVDFAVKNNIGLDFNPTFFSHPFTENGYTLSSTNEEVRKFWVNHGKKSREIAAYISSETGKTCINNIWVPDGEKEVPTNAFERRALLKKSLDEIIAHPIEKSRNIDAVESKLFGIGSESFVSGSHEFYMGYAISNQDVLLTLDTGHFHPTELVSMKLSAMLLYVKGLLLHVSRPVRWDSDHVVTYSDELLAVMNEIKRADAYDKVHIALDYFDASINRIMALIIGTRNTRKAILQSLLEPTEKLRELEKQGDLGSRLAILEEMKTMPFNAIWNEFCVRNNVPTGMDWIEDIKEYENTVLKLR